jgi:hypothetical protein
MHGNGHSTKNMESHHHLVILATYHTENTDSKHGSKHDLIGKLKGSK